MSDLKISICMPIYNNASYLSEAIDSALSQEFQNFELLIIDDCSTDNSAAIAEKYANNDLRVRFIRNPENLGMVHNWNRCLELAEGEYIRFLFGDDFFSSPDALTIMLEAMLKYPDVVLVASARSIVDEQSNIIERITNFSDHFSAEGRNVIRRCMRRINRDHNLIGEPSAVMFRKNAAKRGFDIRYRQLVDLEMWFHIMEQGRFIYLAEPLCSFRHHAGQQTKKNEIELNFIDDLTYLFNDYLEKPYVGIGKIARTYLMYYQFYKLLKHAKQGQHDMDVANRKIRSLYGPWRFTLLRPFYRLYTPYWQLKRIIAKKVGKE
ncbi:MAG: glycosyltransferase family 2 protein [Desulfuromonadaceae bacterium]|nr:glycosyltransferase family 2 protein [Desulfuromonadaceae bacterium]MDD2854297.1 glycosyltransferase family 2 protein [Desulfuromonadaceae bacterium]